MLLVMCAFACRSSIISGNLNPLKMYTHEVLRTDFFLFISFFAEKENSTWLSQRFSNSEARVSWGAQEERERERCAGALKTSYLAAFQVSRWSCSSHCQTHSTWRQLRNFNSLSAKAALFLRVVTVKSEHTGMI